MPTIARTPQKTDLTLEDERLARFDLTPYCWGNTNHPYVQVNIFDTNYCGYGKDDTISGISLRIIVEKAIKERDEARGRETVYVFGQVNGAWLVPVDDSHPFEREFMRKRLYSYDKDGPFTDMIDYDKVAEYLWENARTVEIGGEDFYLLLDGDRGHGFYSERTSG